MEEVIGPEATTSLPHPPHPGRIWKPHRLISESSGRGERNTGQVRLPGLRLSWSCSFCPNMIEKKVGLGERMKQPQVGQMCWQPDRWGDSVCPSFFTATCLCSSLSGLLVQEKDHAPRVYLESSFQAASCTLTMYFPRVSTYASNALCAERFPEQEGPLTNTLLESHWFPPNNFISL